MPKTPHISSELKKEHHGEIAISLNGKIIAIGKNALLALQKAKKIMSDIEEREFVVSRIQYKYLAM